MVDPNELSDLVLEYDFEQITDKLNPICESEAWISIESIWNLKQRITRCRECYSLVMPGQRGVLCDGPCQSWYHRDCVKVDLRKSKWFCPPCDNSSKILANNQKNNHSFFFAEFFFLRLYFVLKNKVF